MRHKNHFRQKSTLSTFSEIGNDWFSDSPSNGLMTPIRLDHDDPFSMWVREPKSANGKGSVPFSSPGGGESPVVRSSKLREERSEAARLGLGIGLMAPFVLPQDKSSSVEEEDFDMSFPPSPEEDLEEDEDTALAASGPPGLAPRISLRRAHTLISGSDASPTQVSHHSELSSLPPMKRRRTNA